jgi:hypothetical protein
MFVIRSAECIHPEVRRGLPSVGNVSSSDDGDFFLVCN